MYINKQFAKQLLGLFLVIIVGFMLGQFGRPVKAVKPSDNLLSLAAQEKESVVANILDSNQIVVGVRDNFGPYGYIYDGTECEPFGYVNSDGKCYAGFDIDIVREFAKRWSAEEPLKLILVAVKPTDRISRLAAGEFNFIAAAMTHKKERDEEIDFSQTYFEDGLQLLVKKESNIKDITKQDLDGTKVGGVDGTTGLDWLREQQDLGTFNYEIVPAFNSYAQGVEKLLAGEIDAFASDGGGLSFIVQSNPELDVVGERQTHEFYGIGVPQGDSSIRELINFTLQAMKEDGTYDEIYAKWFKDNPPFPVEITPGYKALRLEEYPTTSFSPESTGIAKLSETKNIVIGVPSIKGFQADIAHEFANRWLGDAAALDLRIVTTQTGTIALINGEVDLLVSDLLPTWETEQAIDFSQTYAAEQAYFLVYNNSRIQKLEDLRDKEVAVVANTPYNQWIETEALRYNLQVKSFANDEIAFSALTSSEVSAIVGDREELNFWAEQNLEISVLETSYAIPYAIALPQGDYRLRELVDFTLQTMKEDGFYDCLYKKWFPQATPYAIEILPGTESYLSLRYENPEEGRACLPKSTIQRIRERGNIMLVGAQDDFPPMGFIDTSGQWVGFDLDLVNAMAETWGIQVQFVKVSSDQRIPVLVAGEVDLVASGMTHTRQRDTQIDFSQNYFLDGQSLLVRTGSDISGPLDLNNKRVGAIQGTTGFDNITALQENKGLQFKVVSFTDNLAAVDALKNDSIDAFTTDRVALSQFSQQHPGLAVVGEPFSHEPYGLGLPTGDSQFRFLVNTTLQLLKEDGRYDAIYQRWFPGLTPYRVEVLPHGTRQFTVTIENVPSQYLYLQESVIERMQRTKKLVAGVIDEFPPFGNRNENNECCVGFDVDIIKELAKRWLGEDSEKFIEFVPLKTDQRIPALINGEVDIVAAAMTHNRERDIDIDFSQTYFLDGQSLLVHRDSEITELGDLQGKRVGSATGSTSIEQMQKYKETNGINMDIFPFGEHKLGVEALLAGQIDVYTTDRVALLQFAKENEDLIVVGDSFTQEPYGIGIPENDYLFRDLVNSTLQEMQLDGTYARLYQKWFGASPTVKLEIWPRGKYEGQLGVSQAPMVYVPAGEFSRGSLQGENDEQPVNNVYLDDFYIDQYEVTNRLYRECVAAEVCTRPQQLFSLEERTDYYNNVELYDNYPVIWVTWEQADQYCRFVGKRLPTESQWEKAAQGTMGYIYPWGNELKPEVKEIFAQSKDTSAVGAFALDVSGYQVYDMAGNVREWVSDYYDPNYYKQENTRNPIGPRETVRKVVRGGSWVTSQESLWRATNREAYNPTSSAHNLGFRCASDKPPIQLLPVN
jgi:ABC-type amino acid transport substrate-binding protein